MKVTGNSQKQETGRYMNNRVENSHRPFRRRERAMLRLDNYDVCRNSPQFTPLPSITSSMIATITADNFKNLRIAALAEWRQLGTS